MLSALVVAIACAPLYWMLVPSRWRPEVLAVASLIGLAAYDPRLMVLVLTVTVGLWATMRVLAGGGGRAKGPLVAAGLVALAGLFVWNKLGGSHPSVLPSQSGLAFLGLSYLVLKAAAGLIETGRGTLRIFTLPEVLRWIVFLPTYPSGPIEEFEHFRRQRPVFDRTLVLPGLERILFGLVKALLAAHYLGQWASPVFAAPLEHGPVVRLLAIYAFTLRFYFDFSGYSDIAIGVSALFGYDIDENFDYPLTRRNLVQFWQRWHMTLTRWLRLYLFLPISRRLLRRGVWGGDRAAIASGQIVAMTFCGLWHGLSWNFALWGFLQALGLVWVGIFARDVGRRLPAPFLEWWRTSRAAYVLSAALTFNYFALTSIFVVTDVGSGVRYLSLMLRG
jgi:alginate O-acetyltransferase complex protein AlgI